MEAVETIRLVKMLLPMVYEVRGSLNEMITM